MRVILRHHASSGELVSQNPMDRARYLLEQNLFFGLTLDGLAHNVGMSRAALSQSFRQHFGISPMAYRRQRRLDRAIDLLREGNLTVDQVAKRVGFATASHLSNLLAEKRGVRPQDIL